LIQPKRHFLSNRAGLPKEAAGTFLNYAGSFAEAARTAPAQSAATNTLIEVTMACLVFSIVR